jgi:hypothetical protein
MLKKKIMTQSDGLLLLLLLLLLLFNYNINKHFNMIHFSFFK